MSHSKASPKFRKLSLEALCARQLMAADVATLQPPVEISSQETLMVELVNRARSNPAAEASRLGIDLNQGLASGRIVATFKQPLAPNAALSLAADAHSQEMLDLNYFDHKSPSGSTPFDRSEKAGYSRYVAENIALHSLLNSESETIKRSHDMLFRSSGHRTNLLDDSMSELGVGIKSGSFRYDSGATYSSQMTTEVFGRQASSPILTGVVFDDVVVNDDFYSIGEGLNQITIVARNRTSGIVYTTQTNAAGAYRLQLPQGDYDVVASRDGGLEANLGKIAIHSQNVKLDVQGSQFALSEDGNMNNPVNGTGSDSQSGNSNPPIAQDKMDVNSDGNITPLDALTIINHLNNLDSVYKRALDVDDNGSVAPLDCLVVINFLNRNETQSNAGGESPANPVSATAHNANAVTSLPKDSDVGGSALDFMSNLIHVKRDDLVLERVRKVTWPDSSLGLGGFASQVITPGFQSIVRYGGILYDVRSTLNGVQVYGGFEWVKDHLENDETFWCPWMFDVDSLNALENAIDTMTGRATRSK